jgi:hypothetical protein
VDGGRGKARETILSHFVVVVSRDSAEKKCNQTITGHTYGADYILEIFGQKWRSLPNFLALRNRQNLVGGKNNQVSLTIGQILGTAAKNTGWLTCENIPTWIFLSDDLAFSHQHGIYGFKFPKRFSEFSWAKRSLYSLYLLY